MVGIVSAALNKRLYGIALGVVLTLRSVGAAHAFTPIDLGTLPGDTYSYASAVSGGQVVGFASTGNGEGHAVLWTEGRPPPTLTPVPPMLRPTPTRTPVPCVGDCNGSGDVTVNELITMVNIALGSAPLSACTAVDNDNSGDITVNEIITAVNKALNGCG